MQTMRDPQLLPCGHISDLEPILKTRKCCLDQMQVQKNSLETINPSISHLYKNLNNEKWEVDIVDALRRQLEDRTVYHVKCGTFYNMNTIKELFNLDPESMNNEILLNNLSQIYCYYCNVSFSFNARICYPNSVQQSFNDDNNFIDLGTMSSYSMFEKNN